MVRAGKLLKINGGADRDRTDDLLNAIQALSQLSYSPNKNGFLIYFDYNLQAKLFKIFF